MGYLIAFRFVFDQFRYKSTKKFKNFKIFGEDSVKFAHPRAILYLCSAFRWSGCIFILLIDIMSADKKKLMKVVISVLIAALSALAAGLGLTSCNVTRTVTTKSEFYQKGDTSCTIVTKTIESYDAVKKGAF